ncbi:MAG TPA: extradiol dioxygenase, partial [bacterium]|nr:extradiol dioxygenase [bacterium]
WLIMKLPPAEVGVHPGDGSFVQMHAETRMLGALLYLLCDDVEATIADLTAKGVHCEAPDDAPWGRYTAVHLPSGGAIGLYQPHHPLAIEL